MSEGSPFFSILIPTRNRAPLLRYALQSALDQTYKNYEIVVSNNFSSDRTEEVAREIGGDRIRYFRTDSVLPMHESWEFVLNKARGEWILYLCDDDALFPEALGKIHDATQNRATEIVSWNAGMYFLDGYSAPERRGQVELPRATGRTIEISSRAHLKELFGFTLRSYLAPRFQGSFCHRRLMERVRGQLGRFFLPPSPDFTAWTAVMAKTDHFTFIDQNLGLVGEGSHHIEVSPTYGVASRHAHFSEDYGGQKMFEHVPLSQHTYGNWIAESLRRVQEAMPKELAGLEIGWGRYFVTCYFELALLESSGLEVSALWQQYFAALARQPLAVRALVREAQAARYARLLLRRPAARRWVDRFHLRQLANRLLRGTNLLVIGQGKPFKDMLEAVHYASSL